MLSQDAGDMEKFVRFCDSDFGRRVVGLEAEYIYGELKDCRRVLDVGCGIGSFESRLQQLGIVGLDSSKDMLNEAKKRSEAEYVLGDAENLCFETLSFDAVMYITTLEFIPDYRKSIQEAFRVLQPKGRLLIMLLNPISRYFRQHINRESSYLRKVRHTELPKIENYISNFFAVRTEYFLGIDGEDIFDSQSAEKTSLYVIKGERK